MDRRGRWCLDLSLHLNIILSEFCSNLVVISLYLADLREEQKFKHFAVMEKFDSDKQIVKMLPNLKQSQNPWVATLFLLKTLKLPFVPCVVCTEVKMSQGGIFKIESYLINDLTYDMKIGSGGLKL